MARQVLPIVGAVIGAFYGNPQLGYAIGAVIGNAVDPLKVSGPKLGEGSGQTSAEGVYRPIVMGTAPVGGNIIHRGPEVIRKQRDQAGKGGGPVTITERRYRTFAIRVAEGPVDAILRIWMDEKLVYDIRANSQIKQESSIFSQRFRLHLGTEEQLPDPALEAYLGIGNVNSYRGTCYVVFENFDLTDYGDRIPQFKFEVTSNGSSVASEMLVLGVRSEAEAGNKFILPSPDGIDWMGSYNHSGQDLGSSQAMLAAKYRIIIWEPTVINSVIRYSDDSGINFTEASRPGGDFGAGLIGLFTTSPAFGDIVLIPHGFDGIFISFDSGQNFTKNSSIYSHAISGDALQQMSVSTLEPVVRLSGDFFTTSFVGGEHGLSLGESFYTLYADGLFFVGGSVDSQPAIAQSLDGLAFSLPDMPEFTRGGSVSCIAFGNGIRVIGTNHGEIAFKNNDEDWQLSSSVLGGSDIYAADCAWSGEVFVMVGWSSFGPESPGVIAYSENGETWVIADTQEVISPRAVVNLLGAGIGNGDPVPLSSIVDFLHKRVGFPVAASDVSELSDMVDGIVFADGYSAADAIRTLMPIYMFDAVECDAGSGYKLNYVKRGKPVVATITIDDLVDEPEESVREDALERPRVLHLHFQNPTIGYAPAKASPRRNSPDVKVVGEITTSVPVVFSDVDEAWRRADILLRVAWTEVGGNQKLTLSDALLGIAPTDCVGLYLRGSVRRLRMVKQEISGGVLKTEWLLDRQSAYTSNLTGIPLPDPEPPPPSIVGPTISIFGDWPALSDNHDSLVSYAAATGQTPAWWGATYQRSLDDGANYSSVATFDSLNVVMGLLVDPISSASPHYTDNTNVVRVTLFEEEQIDSISQQMFLSEKGAIAVSWLDGGARKWEIMQYRDAEQDVDGNWRLSTLLRGRLNTDAAQHASGDMFVLLDGSIKVIPMQSAWIGMDLTHRAVSNGQSPESASPYTDEFAGNSQREWPVANLFGHIDGNNLVMSCIPRHRFGTDDAPVQSINHDGYRWTATDGSNASTADTESPAHIFDVTGWSTPIIATVSQLNRITGPGPAVSEEIE